MGKVYQFPIEKTRKPNRPRSMDDLPDVDVGFQVWFAKVIGNAPTCFAWQCDVCETVNADEVETCQCGRKFEEVPNR